MILLRASFFFVFSTYLLLTTNFAADWPTYRSDNARSGVTQSEIQFPLKEVWAYRTPHVPIQAWPGPAKWDGYHKIQGLKDRMVFDRALHVVGKGQRVYFGSSVDDKVYCLDLKTGKKLWEFYTEGPVRLAPSLDSDRVYIGSDDGYVYCLSQAKGELHWKKRVGPKDLRLPGNGRMISLWPVRSSVVVLDGKAYAAAGVLPWEQVILKAFDAKTGEQLWETTRKDLPAQGYMLASQKRLYVTAGRERPVVYERETGKRLFQIEGGGGGTYALLVGDELHYGPGKVGELSVSRQGAKDQLASFKGHHMIVDGSTAFLQSDDSLSRMDRDEHLKFYSLRRKAHGRRGSLEKQKKALQKLKKVEEVKKVDALIKELNLEISELTKKMHACERWKVKCDAPYSIVLAKNCLLAGGENQVQAFDVQSGKKLWDIPVQGEAQGLAIVQGRLLVSTHKGIIHCFEFDPEQKNVAKKKPKKVRFDLGPSGTRKRNKDSGGTVVEGVLGPILEYVSDSQVKVMWETQSPSTTHVTFGGQDYSKKGFRKRHEVQVDAVSQERVYRFNLKGDFQDEGSWKSPNYEFDGSFFYLAPKVSHLKTEKPDAWASRILSVLSQGVLDAKTLPLESTERVKGYALILGVGNGALVDELLAWSDLKLVIIEPNSQERLFHQKRLDALGVLGVRANFIDSDLKPIPFVPYFANLIVGVDPKVTSQLKAKALFKHLRPAGGVYVEAHNKGSTSVSTQFHQLFKEQVEPLSFKISDKSYSLIKRKPLPGSGSWQHQYGPSGNSACSDDAYIHGEISVLWFGRPGPRPMPDRGPRNPAPLASNGRLYVQGNRTLFGIDAYNGTILWSKQIPTMRRANMPRDCSNMVATPDALYVAFGDYSVAFEGRTGKRKIDLPVLESPKGEKRHWGYLANQGRALLGSGVHPGSQYLGDEGEWFEHFKKDQISRVASEYVFSVDRHTGSQNWRYDGGAVVNSSIAVDEEKMFFVEGRSEEAKGAKGRLSPKELKKQQFLIALDLHTGKKLWEREFDFSLLQYTTYLAVSEGHIVVCGTDEGKKYHIFVFDTKEGKPLWEHHEKAHKDHHSGHLSRPVIIGKKLYINKHTYKLETGEILSVHKFDYHGCGTQAASKGAIFHRFEYHGMLDLKTGKRTEFLGVRGGCWLGQIPAEGLLLAPETGSGCSCTHAFQTSLAFYPVRQ